MSRLFAAATSLPSFEGIGNLAPIPGTAFSEIEASIKFNTALSVSIGVMTAIAAIWFIFSFITGAIQWLSSGGDKQALQTAVKKLTHSVIGLLVVVASYGLIIAISNVFGIQILNIGDIIINSLHP